MGRAVGDAVGDVTGTNRQADAAEAAASAQRDLSQRTYNQLNKRLTPALNDYVGRNQTATVAGLNQIDQDLELQARNIQRQERLIQSIDPTILEASQQALKLLRGEESSTLAPLKRQRDMQRQKLLNQLREQLGPGAETSTAGIQALTRFDAETDSLFAGAQQQALGNLGQVGQQWTSQRPDMLRELMGRSGLGQQRAGILQGQADRDFSAQSNVAGMLAGQANQMVPLAGAQYVGGQIKGAAQASFVKDAFGAIATGGANYLMKGMGRSGSGGSSGTLAGGSYTDMSNKA